MEIGNTVFKKTVKASSTSEANVEIDRSDKDLKYCYEESCRKIGQIRACYSDDPGDRRLFKIQLHFGFTEKIIIAMDPKTQKTWKAKLDCPSVELTYNLLSSITVKPKCVYLLHYVQCLVSYFVRFVFQAFFISCVILLDRILKQFLSS